MRRAWWDGVPRSARIAGVSLSDRGSSPFRAQLLDCGDPFGDGREELERGDLVLEVGLFGGQLR